MRPNRSLPLLILLLAAAAILACAQQPRAQAPAETATPAAPPAAEAAEQEPVQLAQAQPKRQVTPLAPPAQKPGAVPTAKGEPNLPPAQGGKMVVEAPSFDAGKIKRGDKITHSFVVKNTGTGVLNIHAKPG